MLARVEGSDSGTARRLVLRRVLARRCPQCGEGKLFRAFARLEHSCERCGLVYRREQGSQTGSMYMTAIAGEVFAVIVVFALWWSFDWSTTRFVLVAMPIVLAFCIAFLPLSQALWVGVEYATDLGNREPWAQLRR
jgi:uncharacterized protein (DUF983 family)